MESVLNKMQDNQREAVWSSVHNGGEWTRQHLRQSCWGGEDLRVDGTHYLDNTRRNHPNDCEKNLDFFFPTFITVANLLLFLSYFWNMSGWFLLTFHFPSLLGGLAVERGRGGRFEAGSFPPVTSNYLLFHFQLSVWQPADSPGCGNSCCASAGTPPASLRPRVSWEGGSRWRLISRKSQLISGEGVSAGKLRRQQPL